MSPFCPLSYVPCPITPPPIGVIGGQWYWPGKIGPYCLAMYTYIWHLSQDVPLLSLSHVPSCPPPVGVIGGQWCWPGTIGQLVHIVWLCTHIYGISAKTSPFCPCPMSRHAPPIGVIGGQWCWSGTIGPYCLAMYTYIWHLSQDVPLLSLSHVPSRPPL